MARRGPKPGTIIPRPPHDIITQGGAVGVLLSNRPWRAWTDLVDFSRIVKEHGNRSWSWIEAAQYVRIRPDGRTGVPLARLIVGEGGRFIRFKDGDRLNLRRANLKVEEAVRPGGRVKRETPKSDEVVKREPRKQRCLRLPPANLRTLPALVSLPPAAKVVIPRQAVQAVPAVKRSRVL